MKPKQKIISLLLAICLVAGLLPQAAFAEGTDTGKAIQLVDSGNPTGGISGYDSTNGYDYIYYGSWNNSPIQWRVLGDQTNTGESGLFLLSDGLLRTGSYGGVYFDNSGNDSNAWQNSTVQDWCETFYNGNFSNGEQGAVLAITKSDEAFNSSTYNIPFAASENILNGDKVFFLSAEEAENSTYGFTDSDTRIANCGNSAGVWWLRSPYASGTNFAGAVSSDGYVYDSYVRNYWAARPAFNLDLNSVLFTSAAAGGKAASGMDNGLTEVGDYAGSEWKMTLLDSSRNFAISSPVINESGNTVSFSYSGAQTGTNEYISAVVEDNGAITHYGRIFCRSYNDM